MSNTRVITGEVRLSYANIWEPKSINGSDPKYSVSLLIPKSDTATVKAIEAAIEEALQAGIGKFGGKIPPRGSLKLPLRDGDTEREDEAYAGHYFLNANSKNPPQVVDASVAPILDRSEVYSGCYGRVSITFYAFNTNGNKGVAVGLGNIQKLRDGEPLGGGNVSAESDFGAFTATDDFLS
ncbi:DUF2815 family protein [Rothia sp. 32237D007AR]